MNASSTKAVQTEHREDGIEEVPGEHEVQLDDSVLIKMADSVENFGDVTHDAVIATEFERKLTIFQAIRMYPKPAFFSMAMSLSLIMEGYDTSLLGNFFGYPAFQRKFGQPVGDGTYQLTATWQSSLQAAVQVGEIFGLWFASAVADRYGYKKTMLGAQIFMIGVIFIMFFAKNLGMLLAGEILCGLPWGAFQTLTTTYAAEVSPMALRPYLTTYCNMCWVIGQMISTGVMTGLLQRTDDWGWRIPYATQWFWPLPIIVSILFAPESPWWLVRKGRIDEAKSTLHKMVSAKDTDYDVDRNVAMMIHTNAHEKAIGAETSYKSLFTGVNLRRTEITCCVWIIQVTCGTWFGGNVLYFLEQAGFTTRQSFQFNLGHNAIALAGTISAWWVMEYVGRRKLYLWGLLVMFSLLMLVGFLGIPPPGESIAYGSGTLLMIFTFTYAITVGPVCYCMVTEIPSTRLRIKTVAMARNAYNIISIAANYLNNPILNPTAWNLRGKGGFVWAPFALLSLIWAYYRLPEPKGRSAGEIDVLFEQRVPARKWGMVRVDEFRSNNLKEKQGEMVEG